MMSSSSPILPTLDKDSLVATEDDAKNCYTYQWKYNKRQRSLLTFFLGFYAPFAEVNIQRHFENFRIKSVFKIHVLFWFANLFLAIAGIHRAFKFESCLYRGIILSRLVISMLALFDYYKIFFCRVPINVDKRVLHRYVNFVTQLSNFVIISSALVNGVAYVWKSSLGSCLRLDEETNTYEISSSHSFYNKCNSSYEIGGTPIQNVITLIVGNIFIVVTLRCHSSWAARCSYYLTCASSVMAGIVSPDFKQSSPIIMFAVMTVIIYEELENNSLIMFQALLDLETNKRVQTNELKHFIGNVAHDLKTPLHGLTMLMDSLVLDCECIPNALSREKIVNSIHLCQTNCSFMSTAINRTVDFTKSASNIALSANIEVVSIKDAIQWAVTCINNSQSRFRIRALPYTEDICNFVLTDKHWLMENILCYLSNAVKYSQRGEIAVSVYLENVKVSDKHNVTNSQRSTEKASQINESGSISNAIDEFMEEIRSRSYSSGHLRDGVMKMLCFAVEDEGIGVEGMKKSSLFKPFQQTMRLAGGTGLGLYSLSKRIEALNGLCGVGNRLDNKPGSRFWFSIPYVPDESYVEDETGEVFSNHITPIDRIDEDTKENSQSTMDETCVSGSFSTPDKNKRQEDSDDGQKMFALVVEDSDVISKSTRRMLTSAGYTVHLADNGALGLEMMKKREYSLVIMDLQMPIMDGLEATRRIRAFEKEMNRKSQFIIGTSANDNDDILRNVFNCGMSTFVAKPFSLKHLSDIQQKRSNCLYENV